MMFDPHPPLCDDPTIDILGQFSCSANYSHSDKVGLQQLPLPGIIIFVHGVNSDGEWYAAAEEGLCSGLNERLKRSCEHMLHRGVEGGELQPVNYGAEITDQGFLNPEMSADTLIGDAGSFSPVIRFRWGYKASGEELQKYGRGIYLNEEDYWGGGPFANGCSALADLWKEGLSEDLFLWNKIQHMNPFPERQVYSCPPRAYFVLAAWRLAKLVEAIRQQQADVPISIVCHSQGTMVAMAAAFLGARLPAVQAMACVADNYVICNSPYSLAERNSAENWVGGNLRGTDGSTGRVTVQARIETLKNFFDIIRQQASLGGARTDEEIDRWMANTQHGFSAATDRERYGIAGSARGGKKSSYGRVTIYCNPHDVVVSSIAIQGMGWRGLSGSLCKDSKHGGELAATNAEGVCVQRVFAQGFEVGKQGTYHYWEDHWRKPAPGGKDFWFPAQKYASYSVRQGVEASQNGFAMLLTVTTAPLFIVATGMAKRPANASPDDDWKIELSAPDLVPPFTPQSLRFGDISDKFDEGYDPPGESRQAGAQRAPGDDYFADHEIPPGGLQGQEGKREAARMDSAKGTADDEARLKFEQRAVIRAQAIREGKSPAGQKVQQEMRHATPDADYLLWRGTRVKEMMADQVGSYATDHSSILSNPMHARCALTYDVPVGVCRIKPEALRKLRVAADWRLLEWVGDDSSAIEFLEYFNKGELRQQAIAAWVMQSDCEVGMPNLIIDKRENPRPDARLTSGEMAHG
ncbi:T6SS effector phospholipase Tle3 domain-containing protein [Janthinobacterium sp. HLX7-2]|uniref:T6SS effector phospholipase Tle3 domain-containing protein n=1 Tax=Janthinobacterium sp. HLX7-2 TaxID=1259331 RepID=UPI003F25C5C6